MKTKFFRIGMPVTAFMLAIAFAFATEKGASDKEDLDVLYVFRNNTCETVNTTCNQIGNISCKIGSDEVYEFKSGTSCQNLLTHWP